MPSDVDSQMLAATIAGARSIHALGWHREEVEQAAVERLVTRPCLTTAVAYRQGRSAAIDELRRLTAWRSHGAGVRQVPLSEEHEPPSRSDLDAVDDADQVDRYAAQFDERRALIIRRAAQGVMLRAIAAELHVDPARVTQLLERVRERGRPAA